MAIQSYGNPDCICRESTCAGACCNAQGDCVLSTAALCDGFYMGDDTRCTSCCPLPDPPDPAAAGPFAVGELEDFNSNNVVKAGGEFPGIPDTVLQADGSGFWWQDTGQDGWPGYDMSGRVRYPAVSPGGPNAQVAPGGPFPLVIIAHGNHDPYTGDGDPSGENYWGYTYLQDLLATYGFVSVSLDLDDFNTLWPGIRARAWLVLCHIERMETLNAKAGHTLQNQIDLSRIALIGHSRGGEAVVQAQIWNAENPGGPAVGPGTGEGVFGIKAVLSMAATRFYDGLVNYDVYSPVQPTVSESRLAGGLPFLGIWGDADADVTGSGEIDLTPYSIPLVASVTAAHVEGIYDRSPSGPKQFVWIEGANHNYWNTSWPDDESSYYDRVPYRITKTEQENLAKAYGVAFLLGHVMGHVTYRDYFQFAANQVPPVPIAAARVHLQYQGRDPELRRIDSFESNDSLGTTSEGATGVDTTTLVNPGEIELTGADAHTPSATQSWYHSTRGILFNWNAATDYYETVLPASAYNVSAYRALSFRIAQDRRDGNSNAELTVQVQLRDGSARIATVSTSSITNIPVHQTRADEPLLTKSMLKTIRIRLCSFTENNPNLDLKDIRRVRFILSSRAAGKAAIDDVEFSK